MTKRQKENTRFSWAGPVLFITVFILLMIFFWWFVTV